MRNKYAPINNSARLHGIISVILQYASLMIFPVVGNGFVKNPFFLRSKSVTNPLQIRSASAMLPLFFRSFDYRMSEGRAKEERR